MPPSIHPSIVLHLSIFIFQRAGNEWNWRISWLVKFGNGASSFKFSTRNEWNGSGRGSLIILANEYFPSRGIYRDSIIPAGLKLDSRSFSLSLSLFIRHLRNQSLSVDEQPNHRVIGVKLINPSIRLLAPLICPLAARERIDRRPKDVCIQSLRFDRIG